MQKTQKWEARGGTAQKKILRLANWSQHIQQGPASSLTNVFRYRHSQVFLRKKTWLRKTHGHFFRGATG